MLRHRDSLRQYYFSVTLLLCVVCAVSYPAEAAKAADGPGADRDVGPRIEAVGKLIHQSSAAVQIADSADEAAIAKHNEAKELHERAVEAHSTGDAEGAKRLVGEATRTMFEAVRMAKREVVVADKKRADFSTRLKSVNELVQAYERVRKAKGSEAGDREVDGPIREKLARAKALFEAGEVDDARASLDKSHELVKAALVRLRGGETLVRSLHFASAEDEYRYELDRNDTHRMLLTRVLEEKTDRPELRKLTQPFADRAATMREQAESAAASGEYEQAIEMLEESTAQLLRAIRASGLYIPG